MTDFLIWILGLAVVGGAFYGGMLYERKRG
jgi:hypothetical protein